MKYRKPFTVSSMVFLTIIYSYLAFSQENKIGKITGVVTEAETGEVITGVNISVEGTKRGSATDIEGKYSIALEPGTYNLHVSALSYSKKIITGVTCEAGKELILYIVLNNDAIKSNEVVIEAKANTSYEAVLLNTRKNSATVSDGISAEQIKRAPDATSGDAIRRLTGITLIDNKFVFVRGVSDRYNQTTLNGTSVTSTDVGKKSFSYDMLPANLLENTVVIKSATPDVRGDFTGGLVQLNTLDFPEGSIFKISYTSASNSLTTGKTIGVAQGSSHDWLGYDDGLRSLPTDTKNLTLLAKELPNTWSPRNRVAPRQQAFSLSYGNKLSFDRENGPSDDIGLVTALSYRNNYQRNMKEVNNYSAGRASTGTRDDYSVLWGALANLSFKYDGLHKISFKNNYNRSAEDQVGQFNGNDDNGKTLLYVIEWNQRKMYSGQLTGEHKFPGLGGLSLEWGVSRSTSQRQVPDRKEITRNENPYFSDMPYTISTNKRSWSILNDYVNSYSADLSYPLYATARIKAGFLTESKKTDYRIRYFLITPDGRMSNEQLGLPLDQVYNPSNYGPGKLGMSESSVPQDTYNGDAFLKALYAMVDLPFTVVGEKFRFVSGMRSENSEQNVGIPRSFESNAPQFVSQVKNKDLLPSTNMMWMVNEATNVRIAYSNSVNRPEFRELAGTGFWDFIKYEWIAGNPNLQRSLAHNFDVRFEMFPDAGELIAISYFHKNIHGAIEEHVEFLSTATRSWANSSGIAENKGWEFEVRKSLGFIGQFWKRFSISGNYSRIQSSIKDSVDEGGNGIVKMSSWTRPMQGQSPYMINLSFLYTEPLTGTSINVLYNKFGRRIDATGTKDKRLSVPSDIYEEPRDIVDLSITQPVIFGLELKFSVRNLNNRERVLTQLVSKENGPYVNTYERTKTGSTYSLQISQTL
jgi:TonB-dependent receptor